MDPIALAKNAAQNVQDPSYLPLLLLFLCLAGGAWIGKWLVGRLEKQTTLLEGLFKDANDGRAEVAKVVAVNTTVILECRDAMRENTQLLRRARLEN